MSVGDAIREMLGKGPKSAVDGGEAVPSGAGPAAGTPDLDALKKEARKGGKRAAKTSPDEALARAELQASIDELYTAENWEEIAALYFETRYALTGFDGFRLSEKSKRVLSNSLAMTMKTLAITDPKYVALMIFGVNFCGLIAQKEVMYAKVRKAAQQRRAEQRGLVSAKNPEPAGVAGPPNPRDKQT